MSPNGPRHRSAPPWAQRANDSAEQSQPAPPNADPTAVGSRPTLVERLRAAQASRSQGDEDPGTADASRGEGISSHLRGTQESLKGDGDGAVHQGKAQPGALELGTLETERSKVDDQRRQLEEAGHVLARKVAGERHQLDEQRERLEAERGQLDAQRHQLEAERGQLDAQRQQLEGERGQLDAQRQQLEGERGHLDAQRHQLEAERGHLDAQREQLEAEHGQLTELRRKLDATRRELEHLRHRVEAQWGHLEAQRLGRRVPPA